MNIDNARDFWQVAGTFPADKESVYPDHAKAHHFDEQAKGRALEYGCGGGSDTLSLLRRGGDVFFVDIVPSNVALTRARVDAFYATQGIVKDAVRTSPSSGFVAGRAIGTVLVESADIPVHDNCFDSINCHGVLHHIPVETMHKVLDDMWRVLRPGGRLYAMLYTEVMRRRYGPAIEKLMKAHPTWAEDRAFGHMTDGSSQETWCISRAYSELDGMGLFLDHNFTPVSSMMYVDGDFRTFCCRKPDGLRASR